MKLLFTLLFTSLITFSFSQNYTNYLTGNSTDVATSPNAGICMMGGATENDSAMVWFLRRADGGDILVLRASGSDGYNNYMYSQLGVNVNSVETIVFDNANASSDSYIHQRIQQAEAIWFAGGDQWNYVDYWRGNAIDSLINHGIQNRNIVIGGTSAGMAILGGCYFSAQNGTVTSATAINNPYDSDVTVDCSPFLSLPILTNTITDTHYDNPDRKERHVTFMARMHADDNLPAKGIACDEYTAVCIDEAGNARVFGEYPSYDDNAYFIQINCNINPSQPETCQAGQPLHWSLNQEALKTYVIKGTSTGDHSFDLQTWETGSGGQWETWYVENGALQTVGVQSYSCEPSSVDFAAGNTGLSISPNPIHDKTSINVSDLELYSEVSVIDVNGRIVQNSNLTNQVLDLAHLESGIYWLKLAGNNSESVQARFVKL